MIEAQPTDNAASLDEIYELIVADKYVEAKRRIDAVGGNDAQNPNLLLYKLRRVRTAHLLEF